jgi:drug/metabolite transporter (DMT)-like permease
LLVGGVAVVSRSRATGVATLTGVPEAIGASLALGVYYWTVGELTPTLGIYWPVLATRAVQFALALSLIRWRGGKVAPPDRSAAQSLVAAGVLDTTALVTFNLGVDSAYTSTTAALASLYSAVTIVMAWLFLRERLTRSQWTGIGVLLAGVLLVSL